MKHSKCKIEGCNEPHIGWGNLKTGGAITVRTCHEHTDQKVIDSLAHYDPKLRAVNPPKPADETQVVVTPAAVASAVPADSAPTKTPNSKLSSPK